MRIPCLVCGGRGGWSRNYTDDRVVPCRTCAATGEEPHPATRSLLADLVLDEAITRPSRSAVAEGKPE